MYASEEKETAIHREKRKKWDNFRPWPPLGFLPIPKDAELLPQCKNKTKGLAGSRTQVFWKL
jgi:hypothetical protein